ncbi:PREDICTED: uncharacterized protein LOC109159531 [Ipomoea nil]|uniref:uncharacterized protein LOC109159531 n=1 Tax=Ipomoea nil TaxID=35883 RepID=UPI000900AF71|nr:PREDICTED: uncharacterized protein LOC109159531 [Ipomoea nil]
MADPVRNIIIKLGSKTCSPEVALKHIQTLLQFAMKKKLKLDPLLRNEILVTVMTNYPEFYVEWSEDDATELLMMISEASDEVSPVSIPEPSDGNRAGAFLRHFTQRALESAEVSRRRAESQPLYLEAAQKEIRHRLEILRNRSNNSDSPIEISPDKPDDSITPSCVPVNTENLSALNSEKPHVNVDPSSLPLSESDCVKNDVLHVSDEKEKSSDEPNNLSLVVFSSDNIVLPPAEIAVNPKEICPAVDPSVLPANVESVDLTSPHKSEKTGGILVYTATSLGESLEHVRHFAGLPSASIPQPYRVIHPSESSSEDDKILAEVYGSQAPPSDIPTVEATAHPDSTKFKIREVTNLLGGSSAQVSDSSHSVTPVQSPTKETRRSKKKNVPVKVVVETGDDSADVDQPEKKRKSSETVKSEANPPIQQVFKTLRSSVKQKGPTAVQPAAVPTSSTRKKPSTRSRGRSITPEVQPVKGSDTSVYKPQFVSPAAQAKWSTMVRRDLIVQRSVDENQLNSVCDILPLLNEVGLLKTVTAICPYSKLLTYEFYCNLNEEIDILTGPRPMQIFIREKWYFFGPDMINEYYGLTTMQEEAITDWNLVAKILTGGQIEAWPTGDKDYLQSSQLTSRYVILHRLALHNWLPSAHFHTVGKHLAGFLFQIGAKMPIDLGNWIYHHILTMIHPREQKVRLPILNLIYGILTSQGLEPVPSEVISPTLLYTVDKRLLTGDHICDVIPVTAPSNSEPYTVADDSPHARDLQLSIQLKAKVSNLETVHSIIAKQLTGAHTELATVLHHLSLSEAAAAEPAKSGSDAPSNA